MERSRKSYTGAALVGAIATLLLAAVVIVLVAYTGAYNVAASEGHTAAVGWLLETTTERSVRIRVDDVPDEDRLARADLSAGAEEYKSMCQECHGGPGAEPESWSRGMLPRPPPLAEEASEWSAEEVVWIVRHGMKFTGMPAFGEDHDDEALWNIAAFVTELPAMTPAEYRQRGASHSHTNAAPQAEERARVTVRSEGER